MEGTPHDWIKQTRHLREYIIKGFVMDKRLKQTGVGKYFEEPLARIRDIRASGDKLGLFLTEPY